MEYTFATLSLLAALTSPLAGKAATLRSDDEIAQKLCPKSLCQQHWTDVTVLECNHVTGHEPPGHDYVWGSYLDAGDRCLCPCNFVKFYR